MKDLILSLLSNYTYKIEYEGGSTNQDLYLNEQSLKQLISFFELMFEESKDGIDNTKRYVENGIEFSHGLIMQPNIEGNLILKEQINNLKQEAPFFLYLGFQFNIKIK